MHTGFRIVNAEAPGGGRHPRGKTVQKGQSVRTRERFRGRPKRRLAPPRCPRSHPGSPRSDGRKKPLFPSQAGVPRPAGPRAGRTPEVPPEHGSGAERATAEIPATGRGARVRTGATVRTRTRGPSTASRNPHASLSFPSKNWCASKEHGLHSAAHFTLSQVARAPRVLMHRSSAFRQSSESHRRARRAGGKPADSLSSLPRALRCGSPHPSRERYAILRTQGVQKRGAARFLPQGRVGISRVVESLSHPLFTP